MKILAIMHVASEGPGRFGDFFAGHGYDIETLRLYDGDELPASTAGIDLVLSLGGPMNVYEDETYPFLSREVSFLQKAMAAGAVVLGICLGAQLIARAAGAPVYRAPVKEVGWMEVGLTEQGAQDPLFSGLPAKVPVLQWHGDTFDIPRGGELLATGEDCPHQAFRAGSAWGLQFHLEATEEMIARWFRGEKWCREILDRTAELRQEAAENWERFSRNLLGLLTDRAAGRNSMKI